MRRLIVMVLLLLMVLPAITYSNFDLSYQFGLRTLFWFGFSNNCPEALKDICSNYGEIGEPPAPLMTEEGWQMHLAQFVKASTPTDIEPPYKEMLWIHVPDLSAGGRLQDIKNITDFESDHNQLFN